jgi:hypothetical protein
VLLIVSAGTVKFVASVLEVSLSNLGWEVNDIDRRFEGFTAVTMKAGVFWDVTPYGSCKNRRFGGT